MGLATAHALASQGYSVIVTARDLAKAEAAGVGIAEVLDVGDPESIVALHARVRDVDILINNAAVVLDEGRSVLDVGRDVVQTTMQTNFRGPLLLCQAFVPGMVRRGWGRVVNVSSGAGQLSTMTDYAPAYSMSKAALNAMTRQLAAVTRGRGVLEDGPTGGLLAKAPSRLNQPDAGAYRAAGEAISWVRRLGDNC